MIQGVCAVLVPPVYPLQPRLMAAESMEMKRQSRNFRPALGRLVGRRVLPAVVAVMSAMIVVAIMVIRVVSIMVTTAEKKRE